MEPKTPPSEGMSTAHFHTPARLPNRMDPFHKAVRQPNGDVLVFNTQTGLVFTVGLSDEEAEKAYPGCIESILPWDVFRQLQEAALSRKPGGLWRYHGGGGKYLVLRRDGTQPEWPSFVLGARDPLAPETLRTYASLCRQRGPEYEQFGEDMLRLAQEFEAYLEQHGSGDPQAGPHRKDAFPTADYIDRKRTPKSRRFYIDWATLPLPQWDLLRAYGFEMEGPGEDTATLQDLCDAEVVFFGSRAMDHLLGFALGAGALVYTFEHLPPVFHHPNLRFLPKDFIISEQGLNSLGIHRKATP